MKIKPSNIGIEIVHAFSLPVGCVAQLVERRFLAGKLTLSCARASADG